MVNEFLARIVAPHFVAGLVFRRVGDAAKVWRAVEWAPILRYMHHKTPVEVKRYCDQKGWKIERCPPR